MILFMTILLVYLVQMLICATTHAIRGTRVPTSDWDLIKLTFLPYVIWNFKNLK